MKTVKLENGTVVLVVSIKIVVTRYDLVSAGCFAMHRHLVVNSRKKLVRLTERMIESRGIAGLLHAMEQHKVHLIDSEVLVASLFPEMVTKPIKVTDIKVNFN